MVEGAKILERLLADGRLQRDQYDLVRAESSRAGEHVVDVVIDFGFMSEQDLLRYLAALVRTQFVSTEKLSKAQVEKPVLEMLPVRAAERLKVLPLLFDRKTLTLSVVTCELDAHDVAKQLALLTQAREVRCYMARPRAIDAAIRRSYHGDSKAFRALLATPAPPPAPADRTIGLAYGDLVEDDLDDLSPAPSTQRVPTRAPLSIPLTPDIELTSRAEPSVGGGQTRPTSAVQPSRPPSPGIQISAPDFLAGMANVSARSATEQPGDTQEARRRNTVAPVSADALVETVHVLVSLIEQSRDDLRGHSAHVARIARAVAERMGLSASATNELVLAAHLHDLGKASAYHLTALNVAQYEGHRVYAQKSLLAPVRMFESASLAEGTISALTHMYERFDGGGIPDRLVGKDIPLGARILAIADTYVDVTTTTTNPYRKRLSPEEACEGLSRFVGTVFDETVLDVVRRLATGDESRGKLGAGKRILIVDPDPEESTVLEMRLVERGLEVMIVRDANEAIDALGRAEIDLVVSEVELADRDGLWLIERIRASAHPDLPVILHTRKSDRESVSRSFELGALDYILKPASPDVVAAKVHKALESTGTTRTVGRGVSGSLREMSLGDVLQLLANGRKSGRLQINADGLAGDIGFAEGHVFEASYGQLVGEEAVYAMIVLDDGEFSLDTTYVPRRNLVNVSAESLLLEGMRRMDEQRR